MERVRVIVRTERAGFRSEGFRSLSFDLELVEAKLALGLIAPDEMPALAWDALEADFDGRSIRTLAALNNPSGWETDQIIPSFMAEMGMRKLSLEEASIRVARQLARRILSEGLNPLAYTRDFELLWIRSDYSRGIQDVGLLDDEKAIAEDMGNSEAELREYARGVLLALVATGETQVEG
jgi:hypothetical protein